MNAPPNERSPKWTYEKCLYKMAVFAPKMWSKLTPKKIVIRYLYWEAGLGEKSAKLVIPVRSTFQNDLHPPIGGPHPVLYFTTQIKKKYCTAMCYCWWGCDVSGYVNLWILGLIFEPNSFTVNKWMLSWLKYDPFIFWFVQVFHIKGTRAICPFQLSTPFVCSSECPKFPPVSEELQKLTLGRSKSELKSESTYIYITTIYTLRIRQGSLKGDSSDGFCPKSTTGVSKNSEA